METPGRAYLSGAAGVAGSTLASGVAGFVSLWLLTRILSVEAFGGYAFAMAILALASVLATLGLDRSLLLRIASLDSPSGRLRGGGLALRVLAAGTAAAGAVAVALWFGAAPLVRMGMMPEAQFWLRALGIAAVPLTAAMVLQAWYQANHRIAFAAAMPGIGDLARCLLFAVVLALGLGEPGVAAAVTLAAAVPAGLLAWRARGRTTRAPRRLSGDDFAKGWQFLTLRLAQQGTRQVDLVMMGLLATGAATAEYAIAARIAALADQGRLSLKPTFTPRVRKWIVAGDREAALREFVRTRDASFAAAVAVAAGFTLLGAPVLSLFGPFGGAYPMLLLVALSFVVNAGFGMHASYLSMHGEVGWSAALRLAGLGLLVLLDLVLIPPLGAVGAALAAAASQLIVNAASAALAWRLTGLAALDAAQGVALGAASLALGAAAFGWIAPLPASAVLGAVFLFAAFRSRDVLSELIRMARTRRARQP